MTVQNNSLSKMPDAAGLAKVVREDIRCPLAKAWKLMSDRALTGERHAKLGYRIEPLDDDPTAFLGGFRMWIDGVQREDERVCRITEWNEAAARISMCAEYFDPRENGTIVYATYALTPTAQGCRYSIDCHASLNLGIDDGMSRAQVRRTVEALVSEHDAYLNAGLDEIQALWECSEFSVVTDDHREADAGSLQIKRLLSDNGQL